MKEIFSDAERICDRVDLSPLNGKEIIVTGATGLIGTHLLASLYVAGISTRVWAIHRSTPPAHVLEIARQGDFRLVRHNLASPYGYYTLPLHADVIIHAAGYASPAKFLADPVATIQLNTGATRELLQRLRLDGHFLFLSSAEVYGSWHGPSPPTESDIGVTVPDCPRAPYIEGKRCGEAICHTFRAQGLDAKCARTMLAYGPGTRPHDGRALNQFIEKALVQGHISLLDAGLARRTYCYVSDVVEMLWKILLYGKEAVYNVGGRSIVSISDLAHRIAMLTGADVTLGPLVNGIVGAPAQACLDLTRIETEFGKTNFVNLEEGLRRTIEWQRGLYGTG